MTQTLRDGTLVALYAPNLVEKLFGKSEWVPNRGSESGQEESKESRSVASWRQRIALVTPSAIFQTVSPRTPVNKGENWKGRGLTLRPFGDDARITLGFRNLVVKLAKAKLIQ